jgi:hypothetical protein
MRIHNDANMSFHKDRQSPPLNKATRAGRISLPGQPSSVVTKWPYRHPQWARCAHQPVTSVPGFGPARARAAGPTPPRCAHRVAGMRVTPAHRLPRPPPPDPAAQPRSGRLPTTAPRNHPDGRDRTRCSPRPPRRHAARAICCCQVMHQPTTVTVSASPSSDDGGSSPGAAVVAVAAAALGSAVGVATAPP